MKKLTRLSSIIRILEKWNNYDDCEFAGNSALYRCKTLLSERQKKIIRAREGVKILVSKKGEKNAVIVTI